LLCVKVSLFNAVCLQKRIGAKCVTTAKSQKTMKQKNPNSNVYRRYVVDDGGDTRRAHKASFWLR